MPVNKKTNPRTRNTMKLNNEDYESSEPVLYKPPTSVIKIMDSLQWSPVSHRVNYVNQVRKAMVQKYVSNLYAVQSERSMYLNTFQRRITSMCWHKRRPFLLAVGDKFGNMIIAQQDADQHWSNRYFRKTIEVDGVPPMPVAYGHVYNDCGSSKYATFALLQPNNAGAGSALNAMKFHDSEPSTLFRASLDGSVAKFNLEKLKNAHVYHFTENWMENWFTAMDISCSTNTMLTGDNKGNAYLFTLNGEQVSKNRLHNSKILHCEFNPKLPYLIATSALSTGTKSNHVKLWDLRNLKKDEPLVILPHNVGVNVAHFNHTDGSRLLTSDQQDEIRVYQGPLWDKSQVIIQGHRQFQHITPIKASWHPLYDTIVIGLYPSKNDNSSARSIQFYDADTGKLASEIYPPEPGLVSLNEFNPTGEVLASGMGCKLIIWKPKCDNNEKEYANQNNPENSQNISKGVRNVLRGTRTTRRGGDSSSDEQSDDDFQDDLKKKSKRSGRSASAAQKRKQKPTQSKSKPAPKRGKKK